MTLVTQAVTHYGQAIVFLAIILAFIYVTKLIADFRTKKIDDDYEIVENSNPAVGWRRAGLYLGMTIALIGAFSGSTQGFGADIINLLKDGAIVIVFFFIARFITDKVALRINNDDEALKGNASVGIVEFGNYIATGFILNGCFSGEGGGFGSILLFFLLGQAALIIIFLLYEWATPFNVTAEIKDKNVAAGLALAGMMIPLGIILRASIAGPFTGWTQDLLSFGISAVAGTILLFVFRGIVDRIFLPGTTLAVEVKRDRNVSGVVVTRGAIVALALVISAVI